MILKMKFISVFTNGSYENIINSEEVNNGDEKTATDEDDRTDDTKMLQMKVNLFFIKLIVLFIKNPVTRMFVFGKLD